MTASYALQYGASGGTFIVTVTYGNRLSYLSEVARRVIGTEKVKRIIVVSNAATSPLEDLEREWAGCVRVTRLPENTGSANGYSTGIQAALEEGAEYIWLLDDDNAPKSGALSSLHDELKRLSAECGQDRSAVLGFRPDHQADIAAGVPLRFALPPHSSFFGFHVMHLPYKFWRRTRWARGARGNVEHPRKIEIPFAPYGGLLAHRSTYLRIGLPNTDLILYGDDTEYTYRLTAGGGRIVLVTDAEIEDLEASWNLKARYRTSFEGWLLGGTDLRAYYSSRNQAYFERFCWTKSVALYHVNRALFLAGLRLIANRKRAQGRLALLRRAIMEGEAKRLGLDPEFKL